MTHYIRLFGSTVSLYFCVYYIVETYLPCLHRLLKQGFWIYFYAEVCKILMSTTIKNSTVLPFQWCIWGTSGLRPSYLNGSLLFKGLKKMMSF